MFLGRTCLYSKESYYFICLVDDLFIWLLYLSNLADFYSFQITIFFYCMAAKLNVYLGIGWEFQKRGTGYQKNILKEKIGLEERYTIVIFSLSVHSQSVIQEDNQNPLAHFPI